MYVPEFHCECGSTHRTYRRVAQCLWTHAWWYVGEGPYVLLAHCGDYHGKAGLTLSLWGTLEEALERKEHIDDWGCGSQCTKDHQIAKVARG